MRKAFSEPEQTDGPRFSDLVMSALEALGGRWSDELVDRAGRKGDAHRGLPRMTDHQRETQARARKASRIATTIAPLQMRYPWLTTTLLEDAPQTERDAYAALAECRSPSDTTWKLVIALLRQRENPPADPFDGVAAS